MVDDDSDERWPSSEPEPDPRTLRWRMTPAQKALWHALRRRQLSSYEFHRQRGLGHSDVDFYCDERRLLVVVDGPDAPQHQEQTVERDLALARQGIRMLHVTEGEVSDALYPTLARILAVAEAPLLTPPGREGETP
ncbi:MAG: endonuclease domain-containing protein [Anaerolineae bacterium]